MEMCNYSLHYQQRKGYIIFMIEALKTYMYMQEQLTCMKTLAHTLYVYITNLKKRPLFQVCSSVCWFDDPGHKFY